MEEGYLEGEICNRDGCKGIIQEHDTVGGCSCHINPPCSYCETSREYCPKCNWDGGEEQQASYAESIKNSYKGFGSKEMHDHYHAERERQEEEDRLFYKMYNGTIEPDRLRMKSKSHTHFSMVKFGVFPKGTQTRESLIERVKGTFGGRWGHFGEFSFEYIAYTD